MAQHNGHDGLPVCELCDEKNERVQKIASELGFWGLVSAQLPDFLSPFWALRALAGHSMHNEIVYILVNIWNFFIIENMYVLFSMRSIQNCNKKDDFELYL